MTGDDAINPAEVWVEPEARWYSQYAAKILPLLPLDGILASGAKGTFLEFLSELLNWTIEKNAPPWVKPERRDRRSADLFEWTHSLGQTLGRVSGLLTLEEIRPRFLEPIFALEGDACWALLAPFTSAYVCSYVYDAVVVPADAVTILDLCLGRFLASPAFKRELYRSGRVLRLRPAEADRNLDVCLGGTRSTGCTIRERRLVRDPSHTSAHRSLRARWRLDGVGHGAFPDALRTGEGRHIRPRHLPIRSWLSSVMAPSS